MKSRFLTHAMPPMFHNPSGTQANQAPSQLYLDPCFHEHMRERKGQVAQWLLKLPYRYDRRHISSYSIGQNQSFSLPRDWRGIILTNAWKDKNGHFYVEHYDIHAMFQQHYNGQLVTVSFCNKNSDVTIFYDSSLRKSTRTKIHAKRVVSTFIWNFFPLFHLWIFLNIFY